MIKNKLPLAAAAVMVITLAGCGLFDKEKIQLDGEKDCRFAGDYRAGSRLRSR